MNRINKFHNWRRQLRWNRQYNNGRWNILKSDIEIVRYQQIIDYIEQFGSKKPTVLDLGCGEGILCERMKNSDYSSFLGIDFSSVSIKNATKLNLPNAEFVCANIIDFQPNKKFDVIIFNEIFYYLHGDEKQNILKVMMDCLTENGIIIMSNHREKPDCWSCFKNLNQLDLTTVTTDDDKMYWKIGVYKK